MKPIVCHITNAAGEVVHSTDGGFIGPLLAGLAGMFLPKLLGLGSGETVPYNIHIGHHGKHGMHLGEGHPIPSGHKLSIPALKKYVHQHLMKGEGVFASGVKYHGSGVFRSTSSCQSTLDQEYLDQNITGEGVFGSGVFGSNHELQHPVTHSTHTTAYNTYLHHVGKHLTLNKHHAKGSAALVPHDNNHNSVISDEISNKKKLLAQIYICL